MVPITFGRLAKVVCVLLVIAGVVLSCKSSGTRVARETAKRRDTAQIEDLIDNWKAMMLEGDVRGVHALFSRRKSAEIPLEKFDLWYRENAGAVPILFGKMEVNQIAVEGNGATVLVTWGGGDGRPREMVFVKEDGVWKVDY